MLPPSQELTIIAIRERRADLLRIAYSMREVEDDSSAREIACELLLPENLRRVISDEVSSRLAGDAIPEPGLAITHG